MTEHQARREQRVMSVRLAADPASVPGARRFVSEGLRAWGHEDLVDDASLCVSELAGNAALHGNSTYIEVEVHDLDRAVLLLVEDDGPAPAAAVTPRTTLPGLEADFDQELDDLDLMLSAPTTGRGLAIVSVIASDWGVEELAQGKRVWAQLAAAGAPPDSNGGKDHVLGTPGSVEADAEVPPAGELPDGWVTVRLAGCPVDLSLRQDQHLDELVRELTLMSVDSDNAESAELAHRLEAILRAPAAARLAGRRQSQEAQARGERLVDVEMAMPREFSREIRRLEQAVAEADVLCDEQRLLTLSSPADIRRLREWMTEEIVGQIEHGAAPVAWDTWRAGR